MILTCGRKGRQGAAAVETAMVLGIFMLCLFGVFEYTRMVMIRQLMDNAVREGAREGAANAKFKLDQTTGAYVPQTLTTQDIQKTTMRFLAGQPFVKDTAGTPLAASDILVYRTDASGTKIDNLWNEASATQGVAVEIIGFYQPMVPTMGLLPNPVPVKAKSVMISEENN